MIAFTMSSPCVVIIDDDNELREMLGDIVREEGFTAQTFSNDNCINDLEGLNPDLIVVDHWLAPSHTSEVFIQKVKTNTTLKNIPVVLMSNDRSVGKKIRDSKADVFIAKPFAIEQFLSTLRTLTK